MNPVSRDRIREAMEAKDNADDILEAEHYNMTDQGSARTASLWKAVYAHQSAASALYNVCADALRYGVEQEPVESVPLDPDDAYAQHLAARRAR